MLERSFFVGGQVGGITALYLTNMATVSAMNMAKDTMFTGNSAGCSMSGVSFRGIRLHMTFEFGGKSSASKRTG